MAIPSRVVLLLLAGVLVLGVTAAARGNKEKDAAGDFLEGRAADLVVWSMPLVSTYSIKESFARDLSADVNQVIKWKDPVTARQRLLTPNSNSKYVVAVLDASEGPLNVSLPAASDSISLSGSFVNAWQQPIADVGPSGLDQGRGGDFILIPRSAKVDLCNTTDDATVNATGLDCASVYHLELDTVVAAVALRPVLALDEKGLPLANELEIDSFIRRIRIEPMTESDEGGWSSSGGDTVFVEVEPQTQMDTLPPSDSARDYWALLHSALSHEFPSSAANTTLAPPRDRAFIAMADSILDLKFSKKKKALENGLEYIRHVLETQLFTPFYSSDADDKGDASGWLTMSEDVLNMTSSFESDSRFSIDLRAALFSWATFIPLRYFDADAAVTDKFSYYLMLMRDDSGDLLSCDATYSLSIPADVPARDFWTVNAYDAATNAFIEGATAVGVGSQDGIKAPVDVTIGPSAGDGEEEEAEVVLSTGPSCDNFFLIFRFYGPEHALESREWVLPSAIRMGNVEMGA